MTDCQGRVQLRPMAVADIGAVTAIGNASLPNSWPALAYERDITTNPNAYYFVACLWPTDGPARRGPQPVDAGSGRTVAAHGAEVESEEVVGFAGLWMLYDEAHVATLAVRPRCRQRRIGERLLVQLLWCAIQVGAVEVTLEVRESNHAARALYAKYGFRDVGGRTAYYADSQEDAIIMTTPDVADPTWLALFEARSVALGGL